ncbi:MAG TPA: thiamine pyrophosphate-binding protein [Candidatus Limnocylindrales bacterium]|jgi:benzoylformate decarboxylase
MTRTGRYALLEQLMADDVRYMFGNPGTVEQGFLDALGAYPQLQYVLTLQETVAVAVADGYARATRRPAVVQLHSGVGLGNGVGMLYQARRGGSPLVVIAGEAGLRYDAMDAQMAADLVAIAEPVTKWATRVVDPGSVLRVIRRAMKIAATPPMGPVFVALPADVLDAPNDEDVVPTTIPSTRTVPDAALVEEAAGLLASARRPMIIMGDGVAASEAQAELTRVAETLGAVVWGANSSEVNIDESHPLFQGHLGHMFGANSRAIVAPADAILIVGTYVFPEVFPALADVFGRGARIVHIDLDAYEIGKNFGVDLGLVSDPKLTLSALASALEARLKPADRDAARSRTAGLAGEKDQRAAARREEDLAARRAGPLHASQFMEELARRLPEDALIFDEALTFSPEVTQYLPPRIPGTFFQTRGGSLGVGIPGAIGLKLAHPDRPVIGFTGDGGSMYTIQALWTAAHHRVGAKFVILDNGAYQLLKLNIKQYWKDQGLPEGEFPDSFDLRDPDIRFDQLAQAMGCGGARVETPEQVGPAIDAALADDRPFLIDLVVSNEVKHDEARAKHVRAGQS